MRLGATLDATNVNSLHTLVNRVTQLFFTPQFSSETIMICHLTNTVRFQYVIKAENVIEDIQEAFKEAELVLESWEAEEVDVEVDLLDDEEDFDEEDQDED